MPVRYPRRGEEVSLDSEEVWGQKYNVGGYPLIGCIWSHKTPPGYKGTESRRRRRKKSPGWYDEEDPGKGQRKSGPSSRRKTSQAWWLGGKRCFQKEVIIQWEKQWRTKTVWLGGGHQLCGQLKKVFSFDFCECNYHVVYENHKMEKMSKQNLEFNFKTHQSTKWTIFLA